jgi:ribosomal protein L35
MLQSKRRSKTGPASGQIRAKRPTKRHRVAGPTRSRTKQETILGMLRQPQGATIAAIMNATGWQQHSVRGFFAGVVRKRLKLKLGSKRVDGNRIYQLTRTDGAGNLHLASPGADRPDRCRA